MAFRHLFSDQQLDIVRFCAEEVRRQGDGPLHVAHMVEAWEHAWTQVRGNGRAISPDLIYEIAALVAPETNLNGYRRYGVQVGGHVKMDWQGVPRAVEMLCEAWNDGRIEGFAHPIAGEVVDAAHFYFLFEDIHPFGDGNGRTGKILYAIATETLEAPRWPPNFYGSENP